MFTFLLHSLLFIQSVVSRSFQRKLIMSAGYILKLIGQNQAKKWMYGKLFHLDHLQSFIYIYFGAHVFQEDAEPIHWMREFIIWLINVLDSNKMIRQSSYLELIYLNINPAYSLSRIKPISIFFISSRQQIP